MANAKFMLDEEEHFQELMGERLRLYGERNMEQDFWLVIEPKFLDKFPTITKRLNRPAVALVSTNGPWITYVIIIMFRVLSIDALLADSVVSRLVYGCLEMLLVALLLLHCVFVGSLFFQIILIDYIAF